MKKGQLTSVEDDVLGVLRLEHRSSPLKAEYTTTISFWDSEVKLVLSSNSETGELKDAIAVGRRVLRSGAGIRNAIKKYLDQAVVPALHSAFPDSPKLSGSKLMKQLEVSIIDVHSDGRTTFSFESVEALQGHALVLYRNAIGEFFDFDMPG